MRRTRGGGAGFLALAAVVGCLAGGAALTAEPVEFPPYQKEHWAWSAPVPPGVPAVRNRVWVANPIDAFILAKLEAEGLKPVPTASRETLIRRVAFDLTGLPPAPEEIEQFLADRAPGAYSRMVDRYLASPHYGERWARHWLDLARYADTNGYEHDEIRPDAWRYRDYVVRAFNQDRPYDRFILEQLAGDEITPDDPEALTATGFNLLGPDMTDAADQAARRQNTLNDMTDTVSLVFLGLTVGCARCHDHKYEPISQRDYYRLQAYFTPAQFRTDLPVATPEERARHEHALAEHRAKLAPLQEERDRLAGPTREALRQKKIDGLVEDLRTAFRTTQAERTAEQQLLVEKHGPRVEPSAKEVREALPEALRPHYEKVAAEMEGLEKARPRLPVAMGLSEKGIEAPKTYLLGRGELANRGEAVEPGFPTILAAAPARPTPVPAARSTGRRTALARWIASPRNPLTARVMVNRIWAHHFGVGIVPSPSDLGVRGEFPTHPELLDWLAVAFEGVPGPRSRVPGRSGTEGSSALGWSVKALHRLILNSNSYKQSTLRSPPGNPQSTIRNPQSRRRLEAEAVRDAILAVSGRLNRKMGGPGVFAPLPEDALPRGAAWPVSKDPSEHHRRSLYLFVRRNLAFPLFEVFDAPDTNGSCDRRGESVTATQALMLINDAEIRDHAQRFAGRVLAGAAGTDERIRLAYRLALARHPSEEEARIARGFLASHAALLRDRVEESLSRPEPAPEGMPPAEAAAWTDFCHALFNLNEFLYLD